MMNHCHVGSLGVLVYKTDEVFLFEFRNGLLINHSQDYNELDKRRRVILQTLAILYMVSLSSILLQIVRDHVRGLCQRHLEAEGIGSIRRHTDMYLYISLSGEYHEHHFDDTFIISLPPPKKDNYEVVHLNIEVRSPSQYILFDLFLQCSWQNASGN